MMLPIVTEYNAEYTGEKFKKIAEAMGVDTTGMDQPTYRKAAIDAVRQLSQDVDISTKPPAPGGAQLSMTAQLPSFGHPSPSCRPARHLPQGGGLV